MIPTDKLQEILKLCEKASYGPWIAPKGDENNFWWNKTVFARGGPEGQVIVCELQYNNENDRQFIASANPETVKTIILELLERRGNQKEIDKANVDQILYGTGFLKVEHVPIDEVYKNGK